METYNNLWMVLTIVSGEVREAHTFPDKERAIAHAKAFFGEIREFSWDTVSYAVELGHCASVETDTQGTITIFQIPNNHSKVV